MKYAVSVTYRGFDPDVDDIARKLGRKFGVNDYGSGFDGRTRDIEFGPFGSKTRAVEFAKEARRLNLRATIREEGMGSNPPLRDFKVVGNNMVELDHGDISILYSYETPVAIFAPSGLYRTSTTHSSTTSKHITKWGTHHGLDFKGARKIAQEDIEYAATHGLDPAKAMIARSTSAKMKTPRHPGHQPNPGERIVYRVGKVKVYWSSEWKEYEVRGEGESDGYFTTDKQDAIDTANTIARENKQKGEPWVDTWEERDNLQILLYYGPPNDASSSLLVAEWSDDDARQMFEDGFFKHGRRFAESVIEYADQHKMLDKYK